MPIPVIRTIGELWLDHFGKDMDQFPPNPDPENYTKDELQSLHISSYCGGHCAEAIHLVYGILQYLDPHPSVTFPILCGLRAQLSILYYG